MNKTQFLARNIPSRDFKLNNNDRLLLKTYANNWFLVKRVGQRSWEASCVAESTYMDYDDARGHTVHGNASNLIKNVHGALRIEEIYYISNTKFYRHAMMSIMASGQISNIIDVEVTKGLN